MNAWCATFIDANGVPAEGSVYFAAPSLIGKHDGGWKWGQLIRHDDGHFPAKEIDRCNYPFTSSLRFRNVPRNRAPFARRLPLERGFGGRKEGKKGVGKTGKGKLEGSETAQLVALLSLTLIPDIGFSAKIKTFPVTEYVSLFHSEALLLEVSQTKLVFAVRSMRQMIVLKYGRELEKK